MGDWRIQAAAQKLTYIQVLELQGGQGPRSPRERNLLNILAVMPRNMPLQTSTCIVDLSQSADFAQPRWDGTVPTIATNSAMHCFRSGKRLSTYQMAALMGLRLEAVDLTHVTENQFRVRLGLSIHIAVMGFMLLALLTPAL